MTLQVQERPLSRVIELVDGTYTGSRVFRAEDSVIGTEFKLPQVIAHADFPKIGDQHPEIKSMKVVGYKSRPFSGGESSYVYDVTVNYRQTGFNRNVTFAGGAETQFVDCWRDRDLTLGLPAGHSVFGGIYTAPARTETTGDMGGNPIDSGGEPVSCQHVVQSWSFTMHSISKTKFPQFLSLVGKRNNSNFWLDDLQSNQGKVLYKGFTFQEEAGADVYEVNHQFAYDDWYHLRQVVWRDRHGQPKLNSTGVYANFGYPVHLVEPFPAVGNFALLGITGT